MAWEMNEKERDMVKLVASMCVDTMMGRGPNNKETYVGNLRNLADTIELIGQEQELNLPQNFGNILREQGLTIPPDKQGDINSYMNV